MENMVDRMRYRHCATILMSILLSFVIFAGVAEDDVPLPDTTINLTLIEGTEGCNAFEGPEMLFDNNRATKWCARDHLSYTVKFKAETPVSVSGYVLVTGNDCETEPERNPKTWTLYGKNMETGKWEVIDEKKDNRTMRDVNMQPYCFRLKKSTPVYKKFKLKVSKTQGSRVMQLGELVLFAASEPETVHLAGKNNYSKLTDGMTETVWKAHAEKDNWTRWSVYPNVSIIGYQLYHPQHLKSWELYGCNSDSWPEWGSEEYKLIDSVSDYQPETGAGREPIYFPLPEASDEYNIFVFVAKESARDDGLVKISELVLNTKEQLPYCLFFPEGSKNNPFPSPTTNTNPSSAPQPCFRCGGKKTIECDFCYGKGYTEKYVSGNAKQKGYYKRETCSKCHGNKMVTCPSCGGSGNRR